MPLSKAFCFLPMMCFHFDFLKTLQGEEEREKEN